MAEQAQGSGVDKSASEADGRSGSSEKGEKEARSTKRGIPQAVFVVSALSCDSKVGVSPVTRVRPTVGGR